MGSTFFALLNVVNNLIQQIYQKQDLTQKLSLSLQFPGSLSTTDISRDYKHSFGPRLA